MFKAFFALLKQTVAEYNEDKVSRLAAALAYYTVFSLAPILIIAIAIAGLVFGQEAAQGEIVGQIQGLVGRDGAQIIQTAIENASKPKAGILATVINIVVLLFGASGVFAQLQDALNTVWEVAPKPERGLKNVIQQRFLSFAMVLVIAFLLLTSLVLSAGLAALGNYMGGLLPGLDVLWRIVNFGLSFGVITLLFAMIYKILPDAKIAWGDVWFGAAITALLFAIGKSVLGLYLGNASFGSTYGAAGSLVIILAWVFYSAQILFVGAEFTQVYASKYGSRIVPTKNAVALTDEARAQQGMPRSESVEAAAREQGSGRTRSAARGRQKHQERGLSGMVASLRRRLGGSTRRRRHR